jgi:ornithine cyclodeaminase/alanine dehydrogenase-like protein (mu-crystallin family)
MQLLVLSGAQVRSVLSYPLCADSMRAALIASARGEFYQPLRGVFKAPDPGGLIITMPAFSEGIGYGLKAINVVAGNPARGLDSHQGIVLLSKAETGEPLAVLNASALTEIRTAAVSAVATGLLASEHADVLTIIGTGVQARSHLQAISATRTLAEIRVVARTQAKAEQFRHEPEHGNPKVVGHTSAEEAVAGAGIIVTATNSAAPVLRRDWLTPGTHLNAVGACLPTMRELDTATVADAALFCDSRESVLAEAGDYVLAAADGAIGPDHIKAEVGEVLAGQAIGRTGEREITIFESLGLAIEDLAAAATAYQAAMQAGIGTLVDFG